MSKLAYAFYSMQLLRNIPFLRDVRWHLYKLAPLPRKQTKEEKQTWNQSVVFLKSFHPLFGGDNK